LIDAATRRLDKLIESSRSPEVREIYEHLTPWEHSELMSMMSELRFERLFLISIPMWAVPIAFAYSVTTGLIVSGLSILYVLIFVRRWGRAYQKRVREWLCATEYARSRGYQPETLRMFLSPWNL
jgi:hypothetical protein